MVGGLPWLSAFKNGIALLNESSSFSEVLKGRAAGWMALKVGVQPTPSVYELEMMVYIGTNWIQKFSLTV